MRNSYPTFILFPLIVAAERRFEYKRKARSSLCNPNSLCDKRKLRTSSHLSCLTLLSPLWHLPSIKPFFKPVSLAGSRVFRIRCLSIAILKPQLNTVGGLMVRQCLVLVWIFSCLTAAISQETKPCDPCTVTREEVKVRLDSMPATHPR